MASESTGNDTVNLAVIGGDGIGPEVVAEGLKVLEAVTAGTGTKFHATEYDLGARRWHATGETLPDSVLEELRGHDAILLGAIGDPTVPSGVLERGVLLPLRCALGARGCVPARPVRPRKRGQPARANAPPGSGEPPRVGGGPPRRHAQIG